MIFTVLPFELTFATISGLGLGGLALAFFLYVSHLEKCPLTGRKKFVALREDQIEKIAFKEFQEVCTASHA